MLKEMAYYFDDMVLAKKVNLSKEELVIFQQTELEILYYNGVAKISGGFASITIDGIDEEDSNILHCTFKVGIQNDCENDVTTFTGIFNRKTKKFERI